jgi:hypothetical protein
MQSASPVVARWSVCQLLLKWRSPSDLDLNWTCLATGWGWFLVCVHDSLEPSEIGVCSSFQHEQLQDVEPVQRSWRIKAFDKPSTDDADAQLNFTPSSRLLGTGKGP